MDLACCLEPWLLPIGQRTESTPACGTTLLEVLEILDDKGYGPVTELSFDDGVWEAETYKGDAAFEVSIDPGNGEIISEHRDDGDPKPPTDAMPLAKVIAVLEKAGYADLNDISFERKSWEVEATRESQKPNWPRRQRRPRDLRSRGRPPGYCWFEENRTQRRGVCMDIGTRLHPIFVPNPPRLCVVSK